MRHRGTKKRLYAGFKVSFFQQSQLIRGWTEVNRNKEPFALGIPNEYWEPRIPALVIPLGKTTFHFICIKTKDNSYKVMGLQKEYITDDPLMAASILTEWVKREQEKEKEFHNVVST